VGEVEESAEEANLGEEEEAEIMKQEKVLTQKAGELVGEDEGEDEGEVEGVVVGGEEEEAVEGAEVRHKRLLLQLGARLAQGEEWLKEEEVG